MTDKQDPIAHAAHLLREAAEELRQAHAYNNSEGWENETDAKAAYDEHMAAAQALEDWAESIGAGGVSGPLMGQPQAMPDLSALTERGAKAWAGVDAQALREGTYQQAAAKAAPADTVVLESALRAIHQSIALIGEPDTERLRTVRRVLRGAVIVAEDAGEAATAPQPAPAPLSDEVLNCLDALAAPKAAPRELVHGDVLPPVGSRVYIRHGRDNDAHACTVTGYYAWGDLGGDKRLHRVFVQLVYEGTDRQQARMLCDCYPTAEAALAQAAPQQEAQEPATVPYQKLTNEIDLILSDPDTELSTGAKRALLWVRTWVSVPLYTAPQPAPHLPERDASLPAERQGLFRKFVVGRVDGSDKPGGKHHGCTYFVLDVDHDPCARPALAAYAAACESTHPTLAADLRTKWGEVPTLQPAPAPLSEMPYEKRKAIQEGEQISASDAWFHARINMLDTLDRRNVFRAGFDRGWNAALAAQGGRDAS